ncbi:catechol 2,3-dioxygenase-like lactoylglutathione lyase family enzyme [Pseudomonas frederiksbergensis]|jgi:catechol 2,3-dioxygenase-like lactoylglutathione lyase family enzyme|nr:catechol 2,3-dioxygenase-like lactoylglutathione lyase family enzyme [Pseudomonas sp. URMO17WK12:I6]
MKTITITPVRQFVSLFIAALSLGALLQVTPAVAAAIVPPGAPVVGMIDHVDHIVLTATDPQATIHFYTEVMGMHLEKFGEGRVAFTFGNQKINMHVRGHEIEPKAHVPVPGALDLCFIASAPLDKVIAHLKTVNWPLVEGPVTRTGARGPIRSVYLRDPDLNLIEISEYIQQ